MLRAFSLLCLAALPLLAQPTASQQKSLDGMFAGLEKAGDRLSARELTKFTLEASVAGDHSARIGQALKLLREQQELRADNPNFGNFRWYRGQPEVRDRNAVQFVCQNAMLLALGHPGKLPAEHQQAFHLLMKDAAHGCLKQSVKPSYTNIFLMQAANLVLLGQYLDDPALVRQGRANLREWCEWTKLNGITEFNSTTYTGIDMDCAAQLARLATDPRDRQSGMAILRLLWTEVAANWFAPAKRLGGSHSRDYDYLHGLGATDVQLAANGWIDPAKAETLTAETSGRVWLAPKDWTATLRDTLPREVIQRWMSGPGDLATNWITPNDSIGSCGTGKAYDDKVFAVHFSGDRRAPMAYFVMESRNDPYGVSKEPDSNGHAKTLHLRPALATVQNKDRVLLLAADDSEKPKHLRPVPELKGLWSHLVFPADATVCYADRSPVAAGNIPGDKAVFLRKGTVTLAIRFIAARKAWSANQRLPVTLVRDGDAVQAARFSIEHAIGAHPGMGLIAFAAETAVTPDHSAFATFALRFESAACDLAVDHAGVASLTAGPVDRPLRVSLDLAKSKVLGTAGAAPFPAGRILSVNGQDPWTPIIAAELARP